MNKHTSRRIGRRALVLVAVLLLCGVGALGACAWRAAARETKTRAEAAPRGGRFIRSTDVEIFVQELGPRDAPTVLFVHGMGAWSEIWRETLAATAAAGFRAVAMDLPPFGYSERPTPPAYGRQVQAKRILAVIDALGLGQPTLVGHSFGGGPTLEAVMLDPGRVKALVLADAAIGLDAVDSGNSATTRLLRWRWFREAVVAATVTNPLLTRRLLTQFMARTSEATDARITMLQAPLVTQGATAAFGDWLFDFMTSREPALSRQPDAYRSLAVPTLIIWGDQDTTTPLSQGQRLAQLIPGSELTVMAGVGHMPQIEDVGRFNQLLLAYLRGQRSRIGL